MAFTEIGFEGPLNGTTEVDVVQSPAASTRRLLRSISVVNRDTVAHTFVLYKYKGGTQYELRRSAAVSANDSWVYDRVVVLDATDEKLQIKMLAVVTTTAPCFDSAFADAV